MARTELTIQDVAGEDPIELTFDAADTVNGDKYLNTGGYPALRVRNINEDDPATVTFLGKTECNQGHLHNLVVTLDPLETLEVSPRSREQFNDSLGFVQIDYSGLAATDVEVAVFTVTP